MYDPHNHSRSSIFQRPQTCGAVVLNRWTFASHQTMASWQQGGPPPRLPVWIRCNECKRVQAAFCRECKENHFAAAAGWSWSSKKGEIIVYCAQCCLNQKDPWNPRDFAHKYVRDYLCDHHRWEFDTYNACVALTAVATNQPPEGNPYATLSAVQAVRDGVPIAPADASTHQLASAALGSAMVPYIESPPQSTVVGTPFVPPTVVGTPFPSAEAHAAGVRDLTTQLEDTRQALAEAEERVHQLEVQMNGLVHYIAAWEGGDRQGRGAATVQSEIWALGRSVSDPP